MSANAQAAAQFQQSGKAARVFTEFDYQTRNSWSRARRVIAKAEHLEKGANPRFVVTSLSSQETIFPVPSRWWARSCLTKEGNDRQVIDFIAPPKS